eukprot:1195487-Prorocentrum_minimum.AAC.2
MPRKQQGGDNPKSCGFMHRVRPTTELLFVPALLISQDVIVYLFRPDCHLHPTRKHPENKHTKYARLGSGLKQGSSSG